MNHYHLFGRVFASDIAFPELPEAPAHDPYWHLTTREGSAPSRGELAPMGVEPVMDGVRVSLYGDARRMRLEYGDTGVFEISDHGRTVDWYPPPDGAPDPGDVRKDVLGRVMAVALHAAGIPTLHGSGVDLGGAAVVFLAPKLHGKSTTAAALVRAGGRLLGDDILAVIPGDPPEVLPAVPAVHLWRDSAGRLQASDPDHDTTRKQRVDWVHLGDRATQSTPLDAVYLLSPVSPDRERAPTRHRLPSVMAALALVGQAKIGALLGAGGAAVLLEQLSLVSGAVPVYRLSVPRDLARVDELVAHMAEWHGVELDSGLAASPA